MIRAAGAEPFLIDLRHPDDSLPAFLQAETLIVNVTTKDNDQFGRLIAEIGKSAIENLLFVSSTSVYRNAGRSLSEDDIDATTGPLLAIENLFRRQGGLRTTILRLGGLIGYSRDPGRFFAARGVIEDPDARVNLVHRDDCINIIERIVVRGVWSEIFNCCADTHPTRGEFYVRAARASGLPAPRLGVPRDNPFKTIDNRKVKRMLDYEFVIPDLLDYIASGRDSR